MSRGKFLQRDVKAITNTDSPYTVLGGDDFVLTDASSGSIAITLPAGAIGDEVAIKRVVTDSGGNSVTITPNGSEKIENQTSVSLLSGDALRLVHDGANWHLA